MLKPKIRHVCTFTGSHLRAVTDADADADNAGCHSTNTSATYRQKLFLHNECLINVSVTSRHKPDAANSYYKHHMYIFSLSATENAK